LAIERLFRQRIELIEKFRIVDHGLLPQSKTHAVEQLINSGQHFIDVAS